MLTDFAIRNYRSIRDVWLKLGRLTVVVGPNGSGKSNMYRALQLMHAAADGNLARSIADEGGIDSARWSGKYHSQTKRRIGLSVKTEKLQYDLVIGALPLSATNEGSFFARDLDVKRETISKLRGRSKKIMLERGRVYMKARNEENVLTDYTTSVPTNESVLSCLKDVEQYGYLSGLQEELLRWRFYHHFRTDPDSPIRHPGPAVATYAMSHDGQDMVPALATIQAVGDARAFMDSFESGFPGANLAVIRTRQGLRLSITFPGVSRPLDASEISDGTLQFLCLLCALYAPDHPGFLALNEPEGSIHPDLYEPLARAIVNASRTSQVLVTTHSRLLSDYILDIGGSNEIELEKKDGETKLVGVGLGGEKFELDDIDETD